MSNPKFTLREMQPSDSQALTNLLTEFDGDMTTRFQVDPYNAIIYGTEYRTKGVVVETEGYDGFVGMGTVRFGKVQFNGSILPFAFLDGLKVRKEFRGNGLGLQIASWRIQQARNEFGDDCVIATGMLHDNHASHAVASKWCREFIESAFEVLPVPTLTQQPKGMTGITVLEITSREFEEFARKQNLFYSQYNLYTPTDANSIQKALDVSVDEKKPYRFFVAVDVNGNLLAGAQTWARGILKSDTINNPPPPLRVLNNILHLLPSDFTLRDVAMYGIWYEAGNLKVVQHLWEMIRWTCRDQGTTIAPSFDPRDPARQAVILKPWHQPRPKITIAIQAPAQIKRDQLLFSVGRV